MPPSPELIFETMQAYQRTAALRAGIDLEVFTAIGEGADTVDAIAARCKSSTRGTRMLCDFLTVIGLIGKTGDRYELTPDSTFFLSKHSPAYLGGIMEFMNAPAVVDNFDSLTAIVRRGTITPSEDTVSTENPVWERFARAMVPMMMPPAKAIAEVLGVAAAGPIRVLDLAAGHGIFGIVLAQQNAAAEIVALDWPNVLTVASEHAAKMGVGARHSTIAGDAFTVDFGGDYDVALVTNFLHHFDGPTCTTFLQKVAASLKPGGRVVVLEWVPNDDRVSPPAPAAFVLHMLVGTAGGDAFTLREYRGMLDAAGFHDISVRPLPPSPLTIIVGTK
ncbi:MAG: methyltransferase [Acidobacteriota bacterium]|nr:methyltransferase [Acidobacteriota bacterium]